MFKEFSKFDKKDLVALVGDIFGKNVYSFTRVVEPKEVIVMILRNTERKGISVWEYMTVIIQPNVIKTEVHFIDGLYRVVTQDENEFKRSINSYTHPSNSIFLGGISIPNGTIEYFYNDVLNDIYLRNDQVLGVVSLFQHDELWIPKKMLVVGWDESVENIADPFIRKLLYEEGIVMHVPSELLVKNAPKKYYRSYVF